MESESGQVSSWLQAFGAALARNDIRAVANFFGYDCYWRDLLAFTWTIKTFEGADEITAMLGVTRQPYCVIIGGGQGGIALAARLKRLGVPTLVIEKNERAGDSWRKRYRSLVLHDPVWYDHLPYLPFPDHWPVFSPKDQMGDWLEMYAKVM